MIKKTLKHKYFFFFLLLFISFIFDAWSFVLDLYYNMSISGIRIDNHIIIICSIYIFFSKKKWLRKSDWSDNVIIWLNWKKRKKRILVSFEFDTIFVFQLIIWIFRLASVFLYGNLFPFHFRSWIFIDDDDDDENTVVIRNKFG